MNDDIINNKNVTDFIIVANDFCFHIEKIDSNTTAAFLFNYLQKVLPLLYIKASLLPYVEVDVNKAIRFLNDEEFEEIINMCLPITGNNDIYNDIVNNFNDDRILKWSMAHNIASIYRELKDFLLLFSKDSIDIKKSAVLEVKKNFEMSWGETLLRLHRAIHSRLYLHLYNYNIN